MLAITLYRTGRFLSLILPLNFIYLIAVFLADLHCTLSKKDRDSVYDNIKTIFPEKNRKEIKLISKEVFRNFAKYLVDFFRFGLLNKNNINDFISFENLSYVDDALKFNKGIIALTAHIGNWELGGVALGVLGYKFCALALPHKEKVVDDFFNQQREGKGVIVISIKNPMKVIKYLKDNYIIAIVGDRDFTGNGLKLKFFGKDAYFPKGAAFFSIKSGAPILPVFMLRKPDDKFKLIFEKPIIPQHSEANLENITNLMQEYLNLLEKYIRLYPEQWFMARRFWERQI